MIGSGDDWKLSATHQSMGIRHLCFAQACSWNASRVNSLPRGPTEWVAPYAVNPFVDDRAMICRASWRWN
jgi:hypothetical protein